MEYAIHIRSRSGWRSINRLQGCYHSRGRPWIAKEVFLPELPEVETIVRDLASLVIGRRIEKVRVGLKKLARNGPRRLSNLLRDETIDFVQRQGKFIVIGLSRDRFLIVHLKMTGQFLLGNLNKSLAQTRPYCPGTG